MIASSSLLLLWLCLPLHHTFAHLRGGGSLKEQLSKQAIVNVGNISSSSVVHHAPSNFTFLECNQHLDDQPCATTWTLFFGTKSLHTSTIVIPCGQCILMDYRPTPTETAKFLTLQNGLDIQGKLVFADGYQLHLKTSHIIVQGVLQMKSTKPINGIPDVRIEWINPSSISSNDGNNSQSVNFQPADSNRDKCQGNRCDIGRKPFVVAGGQVVIRGLPLPNMPTWVPLRDVAASTTRGWTLPTSEYDSYQPPAIILECPLNGMLLAFDFSDTVATQDNSARASIGSHWEYTHDSIRVFKRTHRRHGTEIDLKEIRHCLEVDRRYLLTARVRLTKKGVPSGTLSSCAFAGQDCLELIEDHETADYERRMSMKWTEMQSHQIKYGETFTIATEIAFDEHSLRPDNMFQALLLIGPSAGVDVELLEFVIRLPPRTAFRDPTNVCGNLVPGNGDAESVGLSPFPFETNNPETHIVVQRDALINNKYFQITGRHFSIHGFKASLAENGWEDAGLSWKVPNGCVKAGSLYRIHADVRIHPNRDYNEPTTMEILIVSRQPGASGDETDITVYETLVTCPPSLTTWVSCDGEFTVPSHLVHEANISYEILFETRETYSVDYDVDNLSFELAEGPLDGLIVSDAIKGHWVAGAKIRLTSHTGDSDDHQVLTIARVEQEGVEPGHVKLHLDGSIGRPTIAKDNEGNVHYATEVALLSRNIVFDGGVGATSSSTDDFNEDDDKSRGDGAQFMVLSTPDVVQIIQGAEFRKFNLGASRADNVTDYVHHGMPELVATKPPSAASVFLLEERFS
jgi:hypothetical protein